MSVSRQIKLTETCNKTCVAVLSRFIHKMAALFALTLSDADVPPLFPPIYIHDLTVLYVKHVVVTMLFLRVSLLLLSFYY